MVLKSSSCDMYLLLNSGASYPSGLLSLLHVALNVLQVVACVLVQGPWVTTVRRQGLRPYKGGRCAVPPREGRAPRNAGLGACTTAEPCPGRAPQPRRAGEVLAMVCSLAGPWDMAVAMSSSGAWPWGALAWTTAARSHGVRLCGRASIPQPCGGGGECTTAILRDLGTAGVRAMPGSHANSQHGRWVVTGSMNVA